MSADPDSGQKEGEEYIHHLTRDGPVELRAYGHQVGGHALLMKFGKAVCKPMIPRERFFYATIPQDLKDFTPIYHGVVSIRFQQSEDGRVHLFAMPRSTGNGGIGNGHTDAGMENGGMETWMSGDKPVMGEVETLSLTHPIVRLNFYKSTEGLSKRPHEEVVKVSSESFSNPWSRAGMANVQSVLSDFGASQLQDMFQDYLVLEDLTCKYECPCILDLKMGTRQYGDDQSEEKKKRHIETCSASTSGRLGVRISGMQVYDPVRGVYMFKDKYYGRELTVEGFHKALRFFLHSGFRVRRDIIPTLVATLCQLKERVAKQDSYRFFSSSLLIIYDGRIGQPPVDLLGDGDKSCKERTCVCDDETRLPCSSSREGVRVTECEGVRCETGEGGERTINDHTKPPITSESHLSQTLEERRRLVDVRMIDFAHTTHINCQQDPVKYHGSDNGYILGLDTLISAFRTMASET